ncbi:MULTISPECIES: GtrA family protein [Sporosarcina]|uniref:GtrA family protein n=1 Tax=Sporosarcina contaminans TaxID=633403 RepID=A0ABW3U4P3_9BACL
MRRFIDHEFYKFMMVGIVNTGLYYGLYLAGLHIAIFPYIIAHSLAVVISMGASFFLNCYVTYQVKPTWKKLVRFPLTQFVNIFVTFILLFMLVEWFGMNDSIAPIAALFVTVPITFVVTGKVLKTS